MTADVSKPRATRRTLMLVTGVLASIITFAVGAQVASAHVPNIDASVDCAFTVNWTASSWSTDESGAGANSAIQVGYGLDADDDGDLDDENDNVIDDGENPVIVTTGSFGPFKPGTDPKQVDSFTGSFAWPDMTQTSLVVYVYPAGPWGDGTVTDFLDQVVVTRPANCVPGAPTAIAQVECVDQMGSVSGTLTVSAGAGTVAFTLDFPGTAQDQTVSVESGTSVPFDVTGVANGTVTISAPGMASVTNTINCAPGTPTADATVSCVNLTGTVAGTLTVGDGGAPIVFTLDFPGTAQDQTVSVDAGTSVPFNVTGVANGTVTISAPGMASVTNTINCAPGAPSASATATCVDNTGTVAVTLSVTPGGAPIVFTISVPGQDPATRSVPSGSSTDLSFTAVPNGTVTITAPGLTTVTATVDCRLGTPTVAVVPVCSAATTVNVDVTFTVTGGNLPTTFSGPDPIRTFVLNGGESKVVQYVNAPNTGFTIEYTVNGVATTTAVPPVTCETDGTGTASISYRCENNTGTVIVTLNHLGGDRSVEFVVGGTTYVVAKGTTQDVAITNVPNGVYSTTVTVAGTPVPLSVDVANCSLRESEPPAPTPEPPVLTTPPVNQLPVTGTSGMNATLGLGLAFLALGGLAMIVRRRRSSAPTV